MSEGNSPEKLELPINLIVVDSPPGIIMPSISEEIKSDEERNSTTSMSILDSFAACSKAVI